MKYYKIANKGTICFKEGLNTDPSGICFARKNILSFICYGSELYEVEPVGEVYEKTHYTENIWSAKSVNLKHIGNVRNHIQSLIEQGVNVNVDNDYPLRYFSECGDLCNVKILVQNGADIHTFNDEALRNAAYNGHTDVVEYLKSLP